LFDLKYLRDKPDGTLGPVTRAAIRSFQRNGNLRETGEPTKEVFAALTAAVTAARRDAANALKPEPSKPSLAAAIEIANPEPAPPPPTSADFDHAAGKPEAEPAKPPVTASEPPKVEPLPIPASPPQTATAPSDQQPVIALGNPEPPPPPPTSTDIARAGKRDPNAWPTTASEQVMAIQRLLRDVGFLNEEPDGMFGPVTRAAILDYEHGVGLPQVGEPSKALFESLTEMRRLMGPKPN
jgi:peptidoglycan hydrolase-like protein with peptidoglycan-binding domain